LSQQARDAPSLAPGPLDAGERFRGIESECAAAGQARLKAAAPVKANKSRVYRRGSDWNKGFDLKKGLKIWQIVGEPGPRKTAEIG